MKIELYKNGNLVLSQEGKLIDKDAVFGNIVYNIENHTLTREDGSYRYYLNFDNNEAVIKLKEYDQELDLTIKTTSIKCDNKTHEIAYNIESEQTIENNLKVIF